MSATVLKRDEARQDLLDHFVYIGQHNEATAARFLQAVEATFTQLAQLPGLGAPREYGNPKLAGMRMRPVRGFEKYLIFYRPVEGGIEVIRVLHSARDIQSLFEAAE